LPKQNLLLQANALLTTVIMPRAKQRKSFFSLRYFGHLSHSCIKTCRNSVPQRIFSDILTEMT